MEKKKKDDILMMGKGTGEVEGSERNKG